VEPSKEKIATFRSVLIKWAVVDVKSEMDLTKLVSNRLNAFGLMIRPLTCNESFTLWSYMLRNDGMRLVGLYVQMNV
jgi:hypothetical protein